MPLNRATELASPHPLLEILSGKVGYISAVSISFHSNNHENHYVRVSFKDPPPPK